jgi:hypothetical protein
MAGAVGKLDGVFAGVMPANAPGETTLVPVESPLLGELRKNKLNY